MLASRTSCTCAEMPGLATRRPAGERRGPSGITRPSDTAHFSSSPKSRERHVQVCRLTPCCSGPRADRWPGADRDVGDGSRGSASSTPRRHGKVTLAGNCRDVRVCRNGPIRARGDRRCRYPGLSALERHLPDVGRYESGSSRSALPESVGSIGLRGSRTPERPPPRRRRGGRALGRSVRAASVGEPSTARRPDCQIQNGASCRTRTTSPS